MQKIDPNNTELVHRVAKAVMDNIRAVYPSRLGWSEADRDDAAKAFAQASEVMLENQRCLEMLRSGTLNRSEAREYFSRLNGALSAASTKAANAQQAALRAYKLADQSALAAFAEASFPNQAETERQIAAAASKHDLYWDEPAKMIVLAFPKFTVLICDEKLRRTWPKGLQLRIPVAGTGNTTTWIYETNGETCSRGYSGQAHPHILSGNKPCYGDSESLVKAAFSEGRIFDVCGYMTELMFEPRDDTQNHVECTASMPGAQIRCDKCEEWHCESDLDDMRIFESREVGGKILVSTRCTKDILTCPLTKEKFLKEDGVCYEGVYYSPSAIVEAFDGAQYHLVPRNLPILYEQKFYMPGVLKTCCVSGVYGNPVAKNDKGLLVATGPHSLIPLEGGKFVVACCLDLVDQYGTLTLGESERASDKPWWQGLIDNRSWAAHAPWIERLADKYPDLARRREAAKKA